MGEHGTRTQFIKDLSERLITRVNSEATNIEEAKSLMQQYMMEFCDEYDRCGYGLSKTCRTSGNSTELLNHGVKNSQSDNSYGSDDRTSSASASTASSPGGTSNSTAKNPSNSNQQQKMAFETQILKKGVRVLTKNL